MDKTIILSVAGSGKTKFIIDKLSMDNKSLIITYTNNNLKNIRTRVIRKFNYIPKNITIMNYDTFLYKFCLLPFVSKKFKFNGVTLKTNPDKYIKEGNKAYYRDKNKNLYRNRIAKLLQRSHLPSDIQYRLEKFYDMLCIDEVQDFAGHDFNLLKKISQSNIEMYFVGDFYQHTYGTSFDGNVNRNLFENYENYIKELKDLKMYLDVETLNKSYRCGLSICNFIKTKLGINITPNKKTDQNSSVEYINDKEKAKQIFYDDNIVKLYYQKHYQYNCYSNNWGNSKGEDCYDKVCVVLNNNTVKHYNNNQLDKLKTQTRNKLYVACSRARSKLYLLPEKLILHFSK